MKLKQQPEDFQVEEITRVVAGSGGAFAFYRLEKRGWTTPDALALLRRRWDIEPRRLSYGGLKDRHALTTQYLTIFHGPRRGLDQQGVRVTYLGQLPVPYSSQDIDRNRFRLVVRDLAEDARPQLEATLSRLAVEGVPNYFDDQRFGSVSGEGGEFIARLLVRGRFEEALRLALAAPYEYDRAAQKDEKRLLVTHWGDWAVLKEKLPRCHARSLVDYLRVHPTDFRGAVARLRPELRTLYLSAYQSHLWNRVLAAWLRQHCPPEQLRPVALRLGEVPFHDGLDADRLREATRLLLPLPSARLKLAEDDPVAPLVRAVLDEEGLTLRDLQVRGIREIFFSRGERPALCLPEGLTHHFEADELRPGRQKLVLAFDLRRGCYATLIVKRLFDRNSATTDTGSSHRQADDHEHDAGDLDDQGE
jgi:tRNA pseudouridine13 synthase